MKMRIAVICGLLACCVVAVSSSSRASIGTCPSRLRHGTCPSRTPRCPTGTFCLGRYCCGNPKAQCPRGMKLGPKCSFWNRKCPSGFSCYRNRCCGRQIITLPPRCPNGQRATTRCSTTGGCGTGYSCTKGWCCQAPTCPKGWLQGSKCDTDADCKTEYKCNRGICCRRIFIFPPRKCPKGQLQVPGTCPKCPRIATCHDGICCRRTFVLHPPGLCPKVNPDIKCATIQHLDQCDTNSDCGKGFCCPGPCGRECYYRPVIGTCPAVPDGTVGTCDQDCDNCAAQGQLCCSNGCGHVCKKPVKPVKPAFCPPVPRDATACPKGTPCTDDDECPAGHKCCENGDCGDKICKRVGPFLATDTT